MSIFLASRLLPTLCHAACHHLEQPFEDYNILLVTWAKLVWYDMSNHDNEKKQKESMRNIIEWHLIIIIVIQNQI